MQLNTPTPARDSCMYTFAYQSVLHWHLTTFKRSSGAGGKSVVRGSSRHLFGAISIFQGPVCPTSPSTHEIRNTRVHCERRQQRLLVQLYISGTFSHLFGEMSITQFIQSLARTTSIQATEGQFALLLRY